MNKLLFASFLLILATGCSLTSKPEVGDIPFDPELDTADFTICNEANMEQSYARRSDDEPTTYEGEKRGLERDILSKYQMEDILGEDGYITVRFVVNCKGDTGKFRVEEMGFDYRVKQFDQRITSQLLDIVKKLDGWVPRKRKDRTLDTFQYLTFKIQKGQIVKILP